jgi:hypothetical protein
MRENKTIPLIAYVGGATFIRQCETCRRYVKPYRSIRTNEACGLHPGPNAKCRKCGRTRMVFCGFM